MNKNNKKKCNFNDNKLLVKLKLYHKNRMITTNYITVKFVAFNESFIFLIKNTL